MGKPQPMKHTIIILLILVVTSLKAQVVVSDEEHDYFMQLVDQREKDFKKIGAFIRFVKKEETEPRRQVALVYHWMAKSISYDVKAYTSGRYSSTNPEVTFKRRKAVCSGYANLFAFILNELDIETEVVSGIAKGYSFDPKKRLERSNHAWNAVKLDGKWHLVDVTWGAGGVYTNGIGRLKFSQRTKTDYLFSNPKGFIIKHYPMDAQWQLLEKPITLEQYYSDSLNALAPVVWEHLKPMPNNSTR